MATRMCIRQNQRTACKHSENRNHEQAVSDLQSENPPVSSISYKQLNASSGDFVIPKYRPAAKKDVFWKDLADPCRDRFLELSSFGLFQSQTVQDSYWSHGSQSGFWFIQFGKLLSGSCMGAWAFENLVIYLRRLALLKSKLVLQCLACVFIQNRSVGRNLL